MVEAKMVDNSRVKSRSQLVSVWNRFKKNKLAIIGLILLFLLILLAIFAPLFADYEQDAIKQNMKNRFQFPNKDHIFGTDQYGRDVFARIIFGSRISLSMGLITVIFSLAIGTVIGSAAGYYGGKIDNAIMRIMDVFLAIPEMLMAISIVAALGSGMANLLIAMVISNVPKFSRIVRSSILSIVNQEFVDAAKACGATDRRIILRHIIPNAIGPIIVQATLSIAQIIINISSLSFLGLGVKPPAPEWGTMLAEGKTQMMYYPYLVIIPGLAIVITVTALNLVGDGLRDALDPKLKN